MEKAGNFTLNAGIVVTILVLTFGLFCTGVFHHSSMKPMVVTDQASTQISNPSIQACCGGISQHIQSWRNLTLSNFNNIRDILAMLAASLVLALAFTQWSNRDTQRHFRLKPIRPHPNLFAYDPLKLAFARGILNPKIY